jgi:hypothetical protein
MSAQLKGAADDQKEQVMDDLVDANVRADSKNPDQFIPRTKVELVEVKYGTDRLIPGMSKWGKITITVIPHEIDKNGIVIPNNVDKNGKWTGECQIKIYVGYNDCLESGQMLMIKGAAVCITLENEKKQSIIFFIPGDTRQKYGIDRIPDYCSIHISVDGISQYPIIINKEGKDSHQPDPEKFHREAKERSEIQTLIIRNVDQLPSYVDIRIKEHPTLLLSAGAY